MILPLTLPSPARGEGNRGCYNDLVRLLIKIRYFSIYGRKIQGRLLGNLRIP